MSWPVYQTGSAPPLAGVIHPVMQTGILPTPVNSAPPVITPTGPAAVAAGPVQYSPEQWAQMQQQNWQQWAQWQQQYQQWHQQYGAEYQKSLTAMTAAANTNTSVPPPPPNENKPPPPPPPEETTQFNVTQPIISSGYTTAPPPAQYTTRPPPTAQYPVRNDYQNANSKRPLVHNPEADMANKRQMMESSWNRQNQATKPAVGGLGWQSQPPPPQANPSGPTHAQKVLNLEELTEAEKKFDKEFAAWEAQFNKWKDQNVNHPDKTQYLEYEKKWESWRNSLLDRREQMRKKRLALQASMAKPAAPVAQPPPLSQPPPQNFSQPPPLFQNQAAEKPPENMFSKPPPTQNNEPLAFKPAPVAAPTPQIEQTQIKQTQIEPDTGSSFLKSSSPNPGGIPGLDLVKDGVEPKDFEDNPPEADVDVPPPTAKGADMDALSKGLNTILGDSNLLNMLSMVTQKTNLSNPPPRIIDTSQPPPPKPAGTIPSLMSLNTQKSNQSFDDYSDSYKSANFESVNNFDDQTRMSFSNGPNDQEMNYGGGDTDPPYRPAFNDFQRGGRAADPPGRPSFNDFRKSGGVVDPSSRSGFNDFQRSGGVADPLNCPNFNDFKRSGGVVDPPPSRTGFNDFQRGGGVVDLPGRPSFNDFQRGSGAANPPGRSNFNDFKRGGGVTDPPSRPGFNDFQRGGGVVDPPGRSSFNDFKRGGGVADPPYRSGFNDFQRGGGAVDTPNRPGLNDFQRGGGGVDPPSRPNFNDFHNRGERRQMFGGKVNGDYKFSRNNSFASQFQNKNANGQGGRNFQQPNAPYSEQYGENQQDFDQYEQPEVTNNDEQWNEEDDEYEKYHTIFNEGDQVVENLNENPLENQVEPEPPVEDEPMFVPELVIDYEHKPLKDPIPEVSVDISRMFDYRHKLVNRIPYPQRPVWLSGALRNIQQFDPLGNSRFNSNSDREPPRFAPSDRNDQFSRRGGNADFVPPNEDRYGRPGPKERYQDSKGDPESERDFGRGWDRDRRPTFSRNRGPPGGAKPGEPAQQSKMDLEELSDGDWEEENNSPGKKSLRFSPPQLGIERGSLAGGEPRSFAVNRPAPVPVQNITMEDLINPPGRFSRPAKIVIILRGPPGSGKTYLAKLIKDREVENGGSAPRILSLDDYFMVEHEKEIVEDGKRVKVKEMTYEYEPEMEESYRQSLIKSFKKTITDGYFPFVVVDNVNQKVRNFGEMWSFAKQNGFQVFICQLDLDPDLCARQNIHHRTESYIEECIAGWEPTPTHHPLVDATNFMQSAGPISEVEMEEVEQDYQEDDNTGEEQNRSKWDTFDCSLNNLARLDGVSKPLRASRTMEEYLQLEGEWQEPGEPSKPGQKRVRWADLEEQKQQKKMKDLGFVVGQTDWKRLMDPTNGGSALTQTKYI